MRAQEQPRKDPAVTANHGAMNIIVLNSGSNGNAVYVESRKTGTAVLLDCGISKRQIELRLKVHGRYPDTIRGIFVTHEHADHVRGLRTVQNAYHIPMYITEKTFHGLWNTEGYKKKHFIRNTDTVKIDDITIRAIPKNHDAVDPVSFLVTMDGIVFLYATDLGTDDEHIREALPLAHAVMLESNHDVDMLWNGTYPEHLKARVHSDHGHLSNAQAMRLLEQHTREHLRVVILGHLSGENNTDEVVHRELAALRGRMPGFRAEIHIASRHNVGEVISV
jgi:phosphoribosyl 1,2-cyclic phosphodiesterase